MVVLKFFGKFAERTHVLRSLFNEVAQAEYFHYCQDFNIIQP